MSPARERPRLDASLAGKSLGDSIYEVTAEAIEAFARATNDPNPAYRAGPDAVAGPVWPVVPAFPGFMAAARDPGLGVDLRRLLHMGEEHRLLRPIRPGDVLRVEWVLEAVDHLDNGDAFTVRATEVTLEGEPAAEVRGRLFVRGGGRAPARPVGDRPHPVHEHRSRVDDDQMQRYAEASGDRNPIHLDERAARRAGLRRPILHGMCTMAMAVAGAVEGLAAGDPTRVARVRVAFARPVVPGDQLVTTYWPLGGGRFGFETVTGGGAPVIEDAEVEVRG